MRMILSRAMIALAARALGNRRQVWAQAMRNELDAASEDGRPLSFALGCLFAASRELIRCPEGRLSLASHALAICFIVPLAALSLWAGLLGYPYLAFGNVGVEGFFAGRSEQIPLLLVGEWSLAPALTLVILLQAMGQLLVAWFLLERDWGRVSAMCRFNAATVTTLIVVMSMLAVLGSEILAVLAALITETLAILALAWWYEHLPDASVTESAIH